MRNTLLFAAIALTCFTGCKDDNDDSTPGTQNEDGKEMTMETVSPAPTLIRESDLPAPDTNASVVNFPQVLAQRPATARFQAPAGFVLSIYKSEIPGVRDIAFAPNGDAFLAFSGSNQISVMRDVDNDGDGDADSTWVWDAGGVLNRPHGMVFHNGTLYVANSQDVVKYSYTSGQTKAAGGPTPMNLMLPAGGQHPYKKVVIHNNKMYVSIGSALNVGPEDDERRASIQQYNLDGSGKTAFGTGLRNPMPIAINPVTNELWTCVNERDGIGDELVPDYLTSVRQGDFFGYPYVYLAPDNPDPRVPQTDPRIPNTRTPDVLFKAHAAALGLAFYTGTQFPEEYRNDAYVAMRGSWNRVKGYGYKIVRVKLNAQGAPEGGYEDFVTGWHLNRDQAGAPQVFGRPVSITQAPDGSLLITDDAGGTIWRLRYKG